jgi:hypothetical protein
LAQLCELAGQPDAAKKFSAIAFDYTVKWQERAKDFTSTARWRRSVSGERNRQRGDVDERFDDLVSILARREK